jgi:hypothetical protein
MKFERGIYDRNHCITHCLSLRFFTSRPASSFVYYSFAVLSFFFVLPPLSYCRFTICFFFVVKRVLPSFGSCQSVFQFLSVCVRSAVPLLVSVELFPCLCPFICYLACVGWAVSLLVFWALPFLVSVELSLSFVSIELFRRVCRLNCLFPCLSVELFPCLCRLSCSLFYVGWAVTLLMSVELFPCLCRLSYFLASFCWAVPFF